MNAKIYFVFLTLVYAAILHIKVSGTLAMVHFYLPLALLISWLIYWLLVESLSFLYTDETDFKIISSTIRLLVAVMFLTGMYLGGFLIFQKIYDFSSTRDVKGKIVALRENWLPFTDQFNTRIVKVKTNNGENWLMVGNKNLGELWLGQDIVMTESANYPWSYLSFEFDVMTWHNRILKSWPHSKGSWQVIINYYQSKDKNKELIATIKKYVQKFSVDKFFVDYANSFWMKNDLKGALSIFEAGYNVNPHHYDLLKYYGFYLAKSGELKRGVELLKEACEIAPENFEAFYQLGLILYEKGKRDEALPVLKRTLELNPNLGDIKGIIQSLERS